jgi:hypothetical protein
MNLRSLLTIVGVVPRADFEALLASRDDVVSRLGVRDRQIASAKEKIAELESYVASLEQLSRERIDEQAVRIFELEHALEEKTHELDRWLSIGYDRATVERAAEQQLVIEGAPGGEPAKRARIDFNTVTQQGLWEIVRLSFREKNTWFFTDGGEQEFSAAILDPDFTQKVDARQFAFAHGDVIQAEREAQSWRDEDGKLHTKYRITKIHRVFNPDDDQLTFPAAAAASASTEVSQ